MKKVFLSVEYDNGNVLQEIELDIKDEILAEKLKVFLKECCLNLININVENEKVVKLSMEKAIEEITYLNNVKNKTFNPFYCKTLEETKKMQEEVFSVFKK